MTRVIALLLFLLVLPLVAQARQYTTHAGGMEHVIHTRRAPVVVHRALPPFRGQHVYAGRIEK